VAVLDLRLRAATHDSENRAIVMYRTLFKVAGECGQRLGPAWSHFVSAVQPLDLALHGEFVVSGNADAEATAVASSSFSKLPNLSAGLATLKAGTDSALMQPRRCLRRQAGSSCQRSM
jgi:hypothetical protein